MKSIDEIKAAIRKVDERHKIVCRYGAKGRPRTRAMNQLASIGRTLSWVINEYETFDELLDAFASKDTMVAGSAPESPP